MFDPPTAESFADVPVISNLVLGPVVPMPTLPLCCINSLVVGLDWLFVSSVLKDMELFAAVACP